MGERQTSPIESYAHEWAQVTYNPKRLVCLRCRYEKKICTENIKPCIKHTEGATSGWNPEP